MSPRSLGVLEMEYVIPNPPCKRCVGCDFITDCVTNAQRGTVVKLELDRDLGQINGPAQLYTNVFDAHELTISTNSIVADMARQKTVLTTCLKGHAVLLEPSKGR